MELSLDSVLSPGGWVGHLSYFLLVLSMLMRHIGALRILAILSALAGISYDLFWLNNPVGVFWESLLLVVNLGQLGLMHLETRRATFSDEEAAMLDQVLPDLASRLQRRLLDAGVWRSAEAGEALTREGEPVSHLVYLATGEVRITLDDIDIATCPAGAFVGEMTVLTEEPATGTATLSQAARLWSIDARVLRTLVRAEPEILSALRASFAANLRDKLVASNQATRASRASGNQG